ncbi:histidinol-phosphate transaminase [Paenibacillus sp. y28]|uniref:histidinol-phosphate transaminase n=1 Tax=Paenibacillus sp. y28 TaxID=3129110 RepID=UPI0030187937
MDSQSSEVYINPHIAAMKPYVYGWQPPSVTGGSRQRENRNQDISQPMHTSRPELKLNANENPYPPSPRVAEVLTRLDTDRIALYPDAVCTALCRQIAAHHELRPEQVMVGNGSSELITFIFRAFMQPGDVVALPYPTFTLYHTAAAIQQVRFIDLPMDGDFRWNVHQPLPEEARLLVLVNPNAPTGRLLPLDELAGIIERFAGVVVIDEAYIDFADDPHVSAATLVGRYPNLIVLRTFSKSYSLCGARIGYALAAEEFIIAMMKCKDSYNVNGISQRMAEAAFSDQAHMRRNADRIRATRSRLSWQLEELGFQVLPSQTNFVLCRPPGGEAQELERYLAARGVYVRYFPQPRLEDKLRITVGTDAHMEEVIRLIAEWVL